MSRARNGRALTLLAYLLVSPGCHEAVEAPQPPSQPQPQPREPTPRPELSLAHARELVGALDGEAALAEYASLLRADPQDALAGLGLAQTGLEFELMEPAQAVLVEVLNGDKTHAVAARLGLALLAHARYEAELDNNDFELGERQLQNVLAVDAKHPHARALAVLLYLLRAESRGESHAPLAQAICEDGEPVHASLAASCAEEARRRGDPTRARTLFARATRADPEHHGAWLSWGLLELGVGSLRSARGCFEQATRSPWPSIRITAHATLGVTLDRLGDTRGAIAAYRAALELCERANRPIPTDLLFDFGLAASRVASSEAELDEARALLERYLAGAPDDAPPTRRLQVQHALTELDSVRAEHQRAQR